MGRTLSRHAWEEYEDKAKQGKCQAEWPGIKNGMFMGRAKEEHRGWAGREGH